MNSGGRKIKRSKSLYGNKKKSKTKHIFSFIIMILIVGGLIFLGYSIGPPIIEYLTNNKTSESSSVPWSPSDVITNTSSETESALTVPSSSIDIPNINSIEIIGFELSKEDLLNESALNAAVISAKEKGYNTVTAELKSEGGIVNYQSSIELAEKSGMINSGMTAAKIAEIITSAGMTPIAKLNLLSDNAAPKADKTTAYLFESSDSSWFDNKPESGGKPWINPFSESTKQYLSELSAEVSTAGFKQIICDGVIFPPFRNADLNYVGSIVKSTERYKVLIDIMNIYKADAAEYSTKLSVEVSAKKVIEGSEEIFKPLELPEISFVVSFDNTEIGSKLKSGEIEISYKDMTIYDKTKAVFETVKQKSPENEIIPSISSNGLTAIDINEVIRALTDLGYKNYLVK